MKWQKHTELEIRSVQMVYKFWNKYQIRIIFVVGAF